MGAADSAPQIGRQTTGRRAILSPFREKNKKNNEAGNSLNAVDREAVPPDKPGGKRPSGEKTSGEKTAGKRPAGKRPSALCTTSVVT